MLALKVALEAQDPVDLLLFDEVDSGIGGAVAQAVGERLKRLARHRQVICVTHLPMIAALATCHLRVTKSVVAGRTVARIARGRGRRARRGAGPHARRRPRHRHHAPPGARAAGSGRVTAANDPRVVPGRDEFRALAAGGRLVPVFRERARRPRDAGLGLPQARRRGARLPAREPRGRREVGTLSPCWGAGPPWSSSRAGSAARSSRTASRAPAPARPWRSCGPCSPDARPSPCPDCRASAAARWATSATTPRAGSRGGPRRAPAGSGPARRGVPLQPTSSPSSTTSPTPSRS